MSTAVSDIRQAARRANELLRELGTVRRSRLQKKARLDKRIQGLKDKYGPEIETLQGREDELVREIVDLVVPKFLLLAFRGTKTIKLRNGEISMRVGRETLDVIDDEDKIIKRIKSRGGLRRFTRVGKRTLNKEALKRDPDFVAKIRGLAIVRKTSLVIKPSRSRGEDIVRELDNLSIELPPED